MPIPLRLTVDGAEHQLDVDTRTTLLDLLRERLDVISPKKGCDHGQCGSCTVLLDGRRHLTCLALAASYDGAEVVTASGLVGSASPDGSDGPPGPQGSDGSPGSDGAGGPEVSGELHPVHQAFLDHDGYQCGYCTPGQVCSTVGVLAEVAAGHPSLVTEDLTAETVLDDDEIRERMSGNLCRCGAYVGILAAVRQAAAQGGGQGGGQGA